MSSTALPPEQPASPGGDGRDTSDHVDETPSLKVQLSDHLDPPTSDSLQELQQSSALRPTVSRTPTPLIIGFVAFIVLVSINLWRASARRRFEYRF